MDNDFLFPNFTELFLPTSEVFNLNKLLSLGECLIGTRSYSIYLVKAEIHFKTNLKKELD